MSYWITDIFEKGFNEVIFYDDVNEDITLHTNIDEKVRIESALLQPSVKDGMVREVNVE